MGDGQSGPIRIECTECQFARTVSPDEDVLPADVIVEHGDETGHTLNATLLKE